MRSDGEATRARILVAARQEFAQFGLAGARVDRIAAAATASKERLYAYFGDKRSLFQAVLELNFQEVTEAVPLDVSDLPGFAGRLFDHALEHPEHLRMLDWARLEGDSDLFPVASWAEDTARTLAAAPAEYRAEIDPAWELADLVTISFSIATSWALGPEALQNGHGVTEPSVWERRRAAVVAAVRTLITSPRRDGADESVRMR